MNNNIGVMQELPNGWVKTKLSGLCNIVYGKNLPTTQLIENGFPVFGANGIIGFHSEYLYEQEQVMISCRGAYSGKINLSPPQVFITNNSLVLEFYSELNETKKYFYYILQVADRSKLVTGSAQPQVTINNAVLLDIPLPPLPEQHRIVAKLEELFTKLDVSVAELKKAKAQIKRYRQSVLKHAFEGKLTEQWRKQTSNVKGEKAEELLAKIKEERKKVLGKKYKELPPVDTTNLPQLPDGWVWTCLGEIITVSSGNGLTSAHMKSNGSYAVYGGNGVSGYYDKYMFENRKLIIGRVGAKCGVVHITEPFSWVTDNALIVEFNNLDMKFLFYLIHVSNLNQHSVSTAQPVISGAKIYSIMNPLPPLKEQQQIVSEIERHFSVADETEKIIDQSLKQAERLRQSILKEAFSGKLVPQDPNDEPAEKLLERIKVEREKISKTKSNSQALPDGSPKENMKRRKK
ncbi:MAG: restriction endonuclease subunit S [Bacteroidetes bacterium]|nr:restriction endonuclease subunit S [Bacteroidota bacterium]